MDQALEKLLTEMTRLGLGAHQGTGSVDVAVVQPRVHVVGDDPDPVAPAVLHDRIQDPRCSSSIPSGCSGC